MCTVLKTIQNKNLVKILSKNLPLNKEERRILIPSLIPLAKDSSWKTMGSLTISSGVSKKVMQEFFPFLVEKNVLLKKSSKSVKSKEHYSFTKEFRGRLREEAKRLFLIF